VQIPHDPGCSHCRESSHRDPLDDLNIVVSKITRFLPPVPTPDQPSVWTLFHFEADEARAENLGKTLAGALDEPGWYADFFSSTETFIVFPGRVFRYARGDAVGRAAAAEHGRSLNIPEAQLDWPE
jgi:hypothetical protein